MKKLIVIFLGFLLGSIIPNNYFGQEELLLLAFVLTLGSIVFGVFEARGKHVRVMTIFFSSMTAGLLTSVILDDWNRLAQVITLFVFAACAVVATVTIAVREGKQEEKEAEDKREE